MISPVNMSSFFLVLLQRGTVRQHHSGTVWPHWSLLDLWPQEVYGTHRTWPLWPSVSSSIGAGVGKEMTSKRDKNIQCHSAAFRISTRANSPGISFSQLTLKIWCYQLNLKVNILGIKFCRRASHSQAWQVIVCPHFLIQILKVTNVLKSTEIPILKLFSIQTTHFSFISGPGSVFMQICKHSHSFI